MDNDVLMVQKQIKSFNKALSRAKQKDSLISVSDAINELIDYERMTHKMYAKAGKTFLEAMSHEELLAYSADIEKARELIDVGNYSYLLDIDGAKDPKALLWKLYDALDKAGLAFDSEQVHDVAEGVTTISWKDMAQQMYKYKTDENYGLSDVQKWYDSQISLEQE